MVTLLFLTSTCGTSRLARVCERGFAHFRLPVYPQRIRKWVEVCHKMGRSAAGGAGGSGFLIGSGAGSGISGSGGGCMSLVSLLGRSAPALTLGLWGGSALTSLF